MAQGHDVTLFASGDLITRAKLVASCPQALRLNPAVRDPIPYYMMMLSKVRRAASRVRHSAFLISINSISRCFEEIAARTVNHHSRPPGSAGPAEPLYGLSEHAARLHLRGSAPAA